MLTSGDSARVLAYCSQLFLTIFGKKIETNLPHGGLNPIHVTPSLTNSQTLGSYFTARMGRIDIEVPNSPNDTSSKGALACYPRRTFYPLGDSPSCGTARSLGPFLQTLLGLSASQSSRYLPLRSPRSPLAIPPWPRPMRALVTF